MSNLTNEETKHMTSLALSFNEVNFSPVQQNGQVWLKTSELAEALGYSDQSGVTRIYSRNEDEFTQAMSCSVKLTEKGQTREIRVFSLRGCHLIAMFSKTAIAKQFRKWVLDILDKEVSAPVAKTHKSERTALHEAHALLVTKTKHLNSSQAWKLIHQRFNVNDVADIPYDVIPVAVEYVHHLIAMYSNAGKQAGLFDSETYKLVRHLCERVVLENDEAVDLLEKFRGILDSRKFLFYANYIVRTNEAARKLSQTLNFKNQLNEPLIDDNCRVITLSTGQRFAARPNWFNCPG